MSITVEGFQVNSDELSLILKEYCHDAVHEYLVDFQHLRDLCVLFDDDELNDFLTIEGIDMKLQYDHDNFDYDIIIYHHNNMEKLQELVKFLDRDEDDVNTFEVPDSWK